MSAAMRPRIPSVRLACLGHSALTTPPLQAHAQQEVSVPQQQHRYHALYHTTAHREPPLPFYAPLDRTAATLRRRFHARVHITVLLDPPTSHCVRWDTHALLHQIR